MADVTRHEETCVLQGPFLWAVQLGRNHELGNSSSCQAYCTRYIEVLLGIVRCRDLVFNSMNVAISLDTSPCHLKVIVWVIRHTDIIGCSSFVGIMAGTSSSFINKCCSRLLWTYVAAPSYVHSTIFALLVLLLFSIALLIFNYILFILGYILLILGYILMILGCILFLLNYVLWNFNSLLDSLCYKKVRYV